MSNRKKQPAFESEADERAFWEGEGGANSSGLVDWSASERVSLPSLKPSTKTISIRLPEGLLDKIKIEANKRDIPYQSLIKVWLASSVAEASSPR